MALAEQEVELVYGGASIGMMGALADAVLAGGGSVIGVIPQALTGHEMVHTGLTALHVVADLHERKALMARLSDGFLALPGGIGTLEELFEVWTWGQLGLHAKPIGVLDVEGYFQRLISMADHMAEEGFLSPPARDLLFVDTDPSRALQRLKAPPAARS